LNDHNEALAGDVLTSLFINYEWRRLISDALQSHADTIIPNLDDSLVDDYRNKFQALIDDLYSEEIAVVSEGYAIGDVKWIPHDTIPANWLLCNSTVHNRVDYPELYDLLTEFQIDADTFNVPNLHNRVLLGNEVLAQPIGIAGGASSVTLSLTNIPPHSHTMAHTHGLKASSGAGAVNPTPQGTSANAVNSATQTQASSAANTGNAGGSGGVVEAFYIVPSNVNGRFIIKAYDD